MYSYVHKHNVGAQKSQSGAILNTPSIFVTSQRRENRYTRIPIVAFYRIGADFIKWNPPINVGVLDDGAQGTKQIPAHLIYP